MCLQIGHDKTPVYRTPFLIVVYVIVGLAIVIMICIGVILIRRRCGNDNDSCEIQMESLHPEIPSLQSRLEDHGSSDFQDLRLEIYSVDRRLEDNNTNLQKTNFARGTPSPDSRHIIISPNSRRSNLPMQDISNRYRRSDLSTLYIVHAMSDSDRPHEGTEIEYVQLTCLGKKFPSPYQSSEL